MDVGSSTSQAEPSAYFRPWRKLAQAVRRPFEEVGQWLVFIGQTFYYLPLTARKYGRECLARMIDLAWGRGSLVVDGGVISVLVVLGIAIGGMVAIEAWAILNMIGFGALAGIIAGLGDVREMAPLCLGIAFAAQCGCRLTAEIGSMRISEEIDALEVMGLRPIPFVVGTRLIGGLLCMIPGYLLTLLISFFVSSLLIEGIYAASGGTYQHYLVQFLPVRDIIYSTIKAVMFATAVIIIHCYYGYFASGGPVGVGRASGRAVRASLVAIMTLDFIMTIALWGFKPTFVFKG
ncbi:MULTISPECIES: ABC transporter permease [unclassified Mycolicibacterium]|uniref:MlaE family ABC transporter permease n=1 Tax=unclassified Mycolicibacterium TaxID=2636767 RepID=UPI001F4C1C5C|nr:ABC transporter permease [Mycolicibacterium sp. YH-1]UNB52175.1 ABC transporter permease [Mycolicibacterium sp. YH-1]